MAKDIKKNKKLAVGLAMGAGIGIAIALIWYLIYQSQFATYKDFNAGFSLQYPKAWTVVPKPEGGAAVAFLTAKESDLDVFREIVNISINDTSKKPMPLAAYAQLAAKQMTAVFKNMQLVESKPVKIAGLPGYRLLFETVKPDQMRIYVLIVLKRNEAHIFTYMAMTRAYEKYLPLVKAMARSWRVY